MLLHGKCSFFFWDRYETNIHSRNRNKTHNHKFVYLLLFERGEITMNVRKKKGKKFLHTLREEVMKLGKI